MNCVVDSSWPVRAIRVVDRTRIFDQAPFNGKKIVAASLFEDDAKLGGDLLHSTQDLGAAPQHRVFQVAIFVVCNGGDCRMGQLVVKGLQADEATAHCRRADHGHLSLCKRTVPKTRQRGLDRPEEDVVDPKSAFKLFEAPFFRRLEGPRNRWPESRRPRPTAACRLRADRVRYPTAAHGLEAHLRRRNVRLAAISCRQPLGRLQAGPIRCGHHPHPTHRPREVVRYANEILLSRHGHRVGSRPRIPF